MRDKKFKSGFSLVEVLAVMFIAAVVFTAFYTVSMVGTRFIIAAKNNLAAVALANEKMEIIRNLEYSDVGLQGGIPDGNILEDEDVVAEGRSFHVHTFIQYIDDPLDGVYPADPIPNDYKSVKVAVSWKDSVGQTQEVDLLSNFVPPGLETTDGGAPLAINVSSSSGIGVPQATLHITNSAASPAIDFTVQTDDTGYVMIPAAPASMGGYHITISKNGYETVATQSSPALDYQSLPYTPTYGFVSVVLGSLNSYSYVEDQLSNLTIQTSDYQGNPVGNLAFQIDGGKVLGRYASNVNVLDMHGSSSTDAATGQKKYSNISPGNYTIAMAPSAQYKFVEFSPASSPLALIPGADATYSVKVADVNVSALLTTVTDSVDATPVTGATLTLTDSLGATVFSGKNVSAQGIYYYPDSAAPLANGSYDLKIDAPGYVSQDQTVIINKLTSQDIKLVKS